MEKLFSFRPLRLGRPEMAIGGRRQRRHANQRLEVGTRVTGAHFASKLIPSSSWPNRAAQIAIRRDLAQRLRNLAGKFNYLGPQVAPLAGQSAARGFTGKQAASLVCLAANGSDRKVARPLIGARCSNY